jgi:secretory lipase
VSNGWSPAYRPAIGAKRNLCFPDCSRREIPHLQVSENAFAAGTGEASRNFGNRQTMKTQNRLGKKSTGLALALLIFPACWSAQGGQLEITSIIPSASGIKVAWTNSLPGYAFTLQTCDSLSASNWSNAPTRYRWPGLMNQWVEPGTPRGSARLYRVMAEPAPVPQRGKVLSATLIQSLSIAMLQATLQNYGLPAAQARWPVRFYKVLYETVDPFGLAITASGALYIPQGPTNSLPLVSLQHGTTALKSYVPSRGSLSYGETAQGLLYATSGYVCLLPDYQGLGDSPGFQAYLHARTEAAAVVDMLRAVRQFCANNSLNLNSQLFLAGYSQGGHVTMAAHREIETYHSNEFTLTASAPMAGPYDLSGVTWNYAQTNLSLRGFYPLLIAAWLPIYNLGDTFEGLLRAPYYRTLAPLYDGLHTDNQIGLALPSDGWTVLRPDYLARLLSDPNHPLRQGFRDNDVYQWTPVAPMHLYHCSGDTLVPPANSMVAYQTFTNNGACCVSLIDPGNFDHGPGWLPSVLAAKQWFDSLKN